MKLLRIRARNFRAHADTEVDLPESGVIGFCGVNESGKSTLAIEIPSWALFGSRAIRGTMKGVRSKRAPARHVASVELDFEVGGKRYRIERSETDAKLFEGEVPIADGILAVDSYVPKLIGMSWPEFAASFLCQQKDLSRISSMGATERQAFIRSVLGLDRIDAALKACRARKNDLARERDGLAAGLGDREQLATALADAAKAVVDVSYRLGSARRTRDEAVEADRIAGSTLAESQRRADRHTYLSENQRHLRREIETADHEIERVEREWQEADLAARTLKVGEGPLSELPALRQRRDDVIEVRAAIGRLEHQWAQVRDLEEMLATADGQRVELHQHIDAFDPDALSAMAGELDRVRARMGELAHRRAAQLAECRTAADHAAKQARKAERKLDAIRDAGPAGACPTCTRALAETYDLVTQSLETDLSEARAAEREWAAEAESHVRLTDEERELTAWVPQLMDDVDRGRRQAAAVEAARRDLQRLADSRVRIEQQRVDLRKLISGTPALPARDELARQVADAIKEISELETLDRQLTPVRAQASRVDALAHERDERVAARADTVEHIGQIMTELHELAFDVDCHDMLVSKARAASERRQATEVEAARAEEAHRAALAQCERAERALVDYDARAGRLDELTRELRTHTAVAERLDAFRVAQASAIRPELEELTTGFVSLLTDGRHDGVTVTEDFELVLSESGVDTEIVSGGTEDIAALALRLAISQMIAMRAGHPLSLLVLDEPFGSLDAVRRGNVMALIRRLRSVFEQVVIISHIEETRDAADHVIELEYSEPEGRSRVVHSSTPAPARELEAMPA